MSSNFDSNQESEYSAGHRHGTVSVPVAYREDLP